MRGKLLGNLLPSDVKHSKGLQSQNTNKTIKYVGCSKHWNEKSLGHAQDVTANRIKLVSQQITTKNLSQDHTSVTITPIPASYRGKEHFHGDYHCPRNNVLPLSKIILSATFVFLFLVKFLLLYKRLGQSRKFYELKWHYTILHNDTQSTRAKRTLLTRHPKLLHHDITMEICTVKLNFFLCQQSSQWFIQLSSRLLC